ncbi:MAG: GNAT family N-acetyltransferase, partial [Halieaceae bacterium]|nr:GNAT family N-acetyltransferase [Halieaceae bacterium]
MAIQQEFVALKPSRYDVKAFDCGKPDMNRYLARFAAKNMGLKLSMTWVLPGGEMVIGQKTPIAAYYTLASCTVTREEIRADKRLPGFPVPVVLLA